MAAWIKLADCKPDESGWYICVVTNAVGEPIAVPMWWFDAQQEFDNDPEEPTLWMPLPDPPAK